MTANGYETVIGIECHVELSTASKMFCGCPTEFGGEPNTRTCPVCLGEPGSLPVANRRAVEYTMLIGLAVGCEIAPRSLFHRKNYFYPDMPKNYQISQYDLPLCVRGALDVDVEGERRRVGITRVHLEEDTGKTLHVGTTGRIHEALYSLVDYNRAGIALVEIVSEPDIPRRSRLSATSPSFDRSSRRSAFPTSAWKRARCVATRMCRCGNPAKASGPRSRSRT